MDVIQVGYYQGRSKARVPIDRGAIQAAFGRKPDRMRVEVLENAVVLTDIRGPDFRSRLDDV